MGVVKYLVRGRSVEKKCLRVGGEGCGGVEEIEKRGGESLVYVV